MTANLTHLPWINTTTKTTPETHSLTSIFQNAYTIKALTHDTALKDTAILGVLEAIFLKATVEHLQAIDDEINVRAWIKKMLTPSPENMAHVLRYLKKHEDRFNLIDNEAPFMQVATLETGKGIIKAPRTITLDSTDDYLTMRSPNTAQETFSFAEAAQHLITLHQYDPSGIKPGAVGDPRTKAGKTAPIGTGWFGATGKVTLHGSNLAETLLLNAPLRELFALDDNGDYKMLNDLAAWERTPDTATSRGEGFITPTGVCDVLTWQSRRVRLVADDTGVTGVVLCNGDRLSPKFIDAGGRFDPWTAYRWSKNQSSKTEDVWMPLTHDASLGFWRGAEALVMLRDNSDVSDKAHLKPVTVDQVADFFPSDLQVGVRFVGAVYGVQSAVVESTVDDFLTVGVPLLGGLAPELSQVAVGAVSRAVDSATVLGQFAGQLLVAAGVEYAFQADVKNQFLMKLEEPFRRWLAGLSDGSDAGEVLARWCSTVEGLVRAEAEVLIRSAGKKAVVGRIVDSRLVSAASASEFLSRNLKKVLILEDKKEDSGNE